jgi:hypothetical protein
MAYWTYQVDPRNFQMEEMLIVFREHGELHGKDIAFQPRDGEKKIAKDDLVFLCETAAKRNPGVLGKARVTTPPKDIEGPEWQKKFWIGKASDRRDLPRVGMEIVRVFNSRIPRSALSENPCLRDHPFAKGYRGTMRIMTEGEASELDRLADR